MAKPKVDIEVDSQGSLVLLTGRTRRGQQFLRESVPVDMTLTGKNLYVGHHLVQHYMERAKREGLTFRAVKVES